MSNEVPPLHVTQFTRKPTSGQFSIERVNQAIRGAMPSGIVMRVAENRFPSRGLLPRLRDAWRARSLGGEVNHVSGDVHYLTYFLPKARTVLTIHDTLLVERARGLRRFFLWLLWYWLPARRSARIVTISEETRRRLLMLIRCDPRKVTVIPNPLTGSFEPPAQARPEGPFRLLHIGTKPNKNIERVITAVSGLDLELIVVGPLTPAQAEGLASGGVLCVNHVGLSDEELRDVYARADALVFVSTDEGFGLPILEAQAAGRPVIASRRAPMDDVAGQGALLVNPEDVGAIRKACLRLMADPELRDRLVEQGTVNLGRFTPRRAADLYADLFREVAGQARGRAENGPKELKHLPEAIERQSGQAT